MLLAGSFLFQSLSDQEEVNQYTYNEVSVQSPVVYYFYDPVDRYPELLDSLKQHYKVIKTLYSDSGFEEQAESALKILDSLEISEVHLVGKGIGGSITMYFAANFPERVKSLTLVSANGIEELELLGGYHLNHAIYKAKHTAFLLQKHLIPHFGLFKKLDDRIKRAAIQFNSDQRGIRETLKLINAPVLIQHGIEARVPTSVSEEHQRLLPQSQLRTHKENNDLLFAEIKTFIDEIEHGGGTSRVNADNERVSESQKPFDNNNAVKASGRSLIILMLFIVMATMVSEDLTCIGTGLLVARGIIGFVPGTLACLAGIFIGDVLLFLMGRWLATSTIHKAPFKWVINEKDIKKSAIWFEAKGPAIIIASRFIPGSRFPTYVSAGLIGAKLSMFLVYFGIASLLWTPMLVGLATFLGQKMIDYFSLYQDYALWVLLGLLSVLLILFKVIVPSFTFRGRRLLVGKIKRILNWEFWPPLVVYTPVFIYSIYLWIKYRSITLCTLANPGIEDGGFIDESKLGILDSFSSKESVAKYQLIPEETNQDDKKGIISRFMEDNQLEFPVVLKPVRGERGKGVFIPKNERESDQYLTEMDEEYLVQEYVSGKEYGVFYYRIPGEDSGKILSVTKKEYLTLTGDGIHTLEELILKDPRAVCQAEVHFERHLEQLFEIPEEGEVVSLVELGTHARGSLFLDGSELITTELTQEVDKVSKSFDGFYFGRYDIKAPSDGHLKKGEKLTVIELNGLTSESTNIYDPKHSFIFGVTTLMKQWSIAYKIGYEIKKRNPDLNTPGITHILSLLR